MESLRIPGIRVCCMTRQLLLMEQEMEGKEENNKKSRILNRSSSREHLAWRSAICGWTVKGRENRERRARDGVHKRGKVEVQLGPIRAGPHVPAGGVVVALQRGRREQRGQRRGSAESNGPRPCEALLVLWSTLLYGATNTPLQHPPPYSPLPSGTARAEQYKTIRSRETGLDHPDTHTYTQTHS